MTIPNTETFSLIDVKNEVELGGSTVNSLQDAFDNSNTEGFDPTYNNDGYAPANSMLRFRNYSQAEIVQFSYASKLKYIGTQTQYPFDIAFRTDGAGNSNLYLFGANTTIYQYSFSFGSDDIDTITYDSKTLNTVSQEANTRAFSINLSRLYIVGSGHNTIYQYNMSTPWDISTATYSNKSFSLSGQVAQPEGIYVSEDQLMAYVMDSGETPTKPARIYQYSLSTAGDISTASYTGKSVDLDYIAIGGLKFAASENKFWYANATLDSIDEFILHTSRDVSTAVFIGRKDISAEATDPRGLAFNQNRTKLYVPSTFGDNIYQYNK